MSTRELSAEEMERLYNDGKGIHYPFDPPKRSLLDGLVAYWTLEDEKQVSLLRIFDDFAAQWRDD